MGSSNSFVENPFSTSLYQKPSKNQEELIGMLQSKELFLDYTEEPLLIVDTDLRVIAFSKKYQEKHNFYFGEKITKGNSVLLYTPVSKVDEMQAIYQKVLQGETLEHESRLLSEAGLFIIYCNKYKPVYGKKKQVIGIFISVGSITEVNNTCKETAQDDIKYRPILENSLNAFFLDSPDGTIIDANQAAVDMFGYTLEELKTIDKKQIIDFTDETFTKLLAQRTKFGQIKGELTGIRKNGESFPCEFSSVLYRDTNNDLKACTFMCDISARKNAEKAVELSEKRFRTLIENASDIIILSDENGTVNYISPAFERVTGFSLEEIQQEPSLLLSRLHPDYLQEIKRTFREALEMPNQPIYRMARYQHKKGHYVWIEGVITNMLQEENVRAVVSNYRDITQRKAAEEKALKSESKFQALVENAGDIIVLTDSKGYVEYVSPAFEKITGFHASEVIGRRNIEFMHPEQARDTQGLYNKLLQIPGFSLPRTNRLLHKNGNYIWVEGSLTNLLHDENVQAIVSNYHDITERIKCAKIIKESENYLQTIFENTSEAFLLIDKHGIVKAFNRKAKKYAFFNKDKEMEPGEHVMKFISDERKEYVEMLFARAYSGEVIQYDRYYVLENGKEWWIDFLITPVITDGQINGICITGRDITARKQAEEELKKRELRFRSIIENSHDLLFLFDADGKIEFLSPAIEKTFGYVNKEDEILHILDSIHPEDLEAAIERLRLAFHQPETPVAITLRKKKKDGSYIWLEGTLTNMLHVPEIKVIIANFRDITERKRFEDQQALFVSIVNSSEDAIVSKSIDEVILSWNRGAEKLFGYTAEEVIGKSSNIIIPPESQQDEISITEKIKKGIFVEQYETRRMKKTGELVDVSLTVSPVKDSKGNITGASEIAHDISDRKNAEDKIKNNEKRFRSLLQNSTDGLSLLTAEGIMLEISPTGKKIIGYEEEEMIGKARHDLIHPDDLPHVADAFLAVLDDPADVRNFVYRSLMRDGTYKWLEASCQNLLNEPAVGAVVVNYRDITERKNQEIERELLIKTLHQNNNDLRNFSYITSHNLKAPLSNLVGFINLLEGVSITDPVLASIIEGFKNSTILLNETVNDLVKILIIKENNSIEQRRIAFSRIFHQVCSQLTNLINDIKPEINVNFSKVPEVVFNDTYLESIFLNLLTNAIKYRSYERQLVIDINTEETTEAIVLTFTDNGIGLDVERHRAKIFGLYQRFHNRPNSKGLGLYLIKSQMESLEGSIDIESQVEVGTTFILKFKKF
ncbi:PAS domain S-box protein [Emticicia sp. 17c]|uniref:PAS domain S-box protein n=1 Tax=Emticicia sp. 17c TaxID=3127704 RepID=UPI00301CF984